VRTPREGSTLSEVESRVAMTREALDKARAEVTEARKDYIAADAEWISTGNKRAAEKRRDASDQLERAEVLAKRAEDLHSQAGVELAQVQRADSMAKYERARDSVVAFQAATADKASAFVALDRLVDDAVVSLARELAESIQVYERAAFLADTLGMLGDLDRATRAPSVSQMRLEISRHVTKARRDEHRDPLAPGWLADASADLRWPRNEMTHEELENTDAHTANLQNAARASAMATANLMGRIVGAHEGAVLTAPNETVSYEEDAS
jgi:hypothetical protein